MRPAGVAVEGPGGQLLAGVVDAEEQGLVQQFVAHAAVEDLDEAVLGRLAGGDVIAMRRAGPRSKPGPPWRRTLCRCR